LKLGLLKAVGYQKNSYVKTGVYVSCTTDEIRMLQKFYYNGDLYVEIGDEFGGNKFGFISLCGEREVKEQNEL
jgi:hypothetical protein